MRHDAALFSAGNVYDGAGSARWRAGVTMKGERMALRVERIEDIFSLADFISDLLGPLAEVVVHDMSDAEASIVYIKNGRLSGRRVGDGATDASLRLIHEGRQRECDYVANYTGKAGDHRSFRSSTYFIDDVAGNLIGLLCVNLEVTALASAVDVLQALVQGSAAAQDVPEAGQTALEENLQGDPNETVVRIVRRVLDSYAIEPARMSREERIEALQKIYNEGVFLMKGAVTLVARELGVSAPTIYKYLQKIKA